MTAEAAGTAAPAPPVADGMRQRGEWNPLWDGLLDTARAASGVNSGR